MVPRTEKTDSYDNFTSEQLHTGNSSIFIAPQKFSSVIKSRDYWIWAIFYMPVCLFWINMYTGTIGARAQYIAVTSGIA
jgi:hypothetical protein